MPLKAGTVNDLSNSMAQAIATAFADQWPLVMGDRELPANNPQTQLLFVAIARGVITHLVQNPEAFQVEVTITDATTAEGEVTQIQAEL